MLTIDTGGPTCATVIRQQLAAHPHKDAGKLLRCCPDFDAATSKFAHLHCPFGALFFYDGSVCWPTARGVRCAVGHWEGPDGYLVRYSGGAWIWHGPLHPGMQRIILGGGRPRPSSVADGVWDVLRTAGREHDPVLQPGDEPRRNDERAQAIARSGPMSWRTLSLYTDGSYLAYGISGWSHGRGTLYVAPTLVADWVGDHSGFYWSFVRLPEAHRPADLVARLAALRAEPIRGHVLGEEVAA